MGCKVIEGPTRVGECVIGVKLGKVNIVSENRETATAALLAATPDTTAHTLAPHFTSQSFLTLCVLLYSLANPATPSMRPIITGKDHNVPARRLKSLNCATRLHSHMPITLAYLNQER
ncbi:hypothetical protein J6590_020795 [Homalodisca vitripennis]|nr:hypothetical protein J6590_020795 [Homalodisca vitripennis]